MGDVARGWLGVVLERVAMVVAQTRRQRLEKTKNIKQVVKT